MIRLTADAAMKSKLGQLDQPAEIRDTDGNVIGYFTPAGHHEVLLYRDAAAHLDPDEMKRRKESGAKGFTTNEVLEHLKSTEKP